MKRSGLRNFLTNGSRFEKGHPLSRRVYLLNALLLCMFAFSVSFALLNILVPGSYGALYVNIACALSSLATLVYFHKTDKLNVATYIAIALLVAMLLSYYEIVGNEGYSLYWMIVVPPVAYFMLGVKRARPVVILFFTYMLCFILIKESDWQPAAFTSGSLLNIIGASLSLILLISFFEKSRRDAADALKKANEVLTESKNEFRLILDTAAEGIFGIDTEGKCTFCNSRCIELLGYESENDLIGKDMHLILHGRPEDDPETPAAECPIRKAVLSGEKVHTEDGAFKRADGSSFCMELFAYPKYIDGKCVGAVITFLDISKRKLNEERLQYLNRHDSLTGLLNRQYFELAMEEYDKPEFLPLSIIYGDLNGLKMTNDIFGHIAGDELIKKAANVLKATCRKNDTVARVGGDEFVWLLPGTDEEAVGRIMVRVQSKLKQEKSLIIKVSLSLGSYTRLDGGESMTRAIQRAEEDMYIKKSLDKRNNEDAMLKDIVEALYKRCPHAKSHSENTSALCAEMGRALGWSEADVRSVADAGCYHDIGKITLGAGFINNGAPLSPMERAEKRQHPVMGYRILSLFSSTLDLAEAVYSHHEYWDGSGYPRGLKGEEIPLASRIIAIAEHYDHLTNRPCSQRLEKEEALERIKRLEGVKYDPRLVKLFIDIMNN